MQHLTEAAKTLTSRELGRPVVPIPPHHRGDPGVSAGSTHWLLYPALLEMVIYRSSPRNSSLQQLLCSRGVWEGLSLLSRPEGRSIPSDNPITSYCCASSQAIY